MDFVQSFYRLEFDQDGAFNEQIRDKQANIDLIIINFANIANSTLRLIAFNVNELCKFPLPSFFLFPDLCISVFICG